MPNKVFSYCSKIVEACCYRIPSVAIHLCQYNVMQFSKRIFADDTLLIRLSLKVQSSLQKILSYAYVSIAQP